MWYCQSCWHIVTADAFHFYAYFASMKDFWILHMLKNSKNEYEYKPLSNCLKCFPDSIKDNFQRLLLVTKLPTRKNWNKSEKLNMVEGVWCQNIIVTKDFGTFIYITIMLHHCDTTKPVKQLFDVREGCIATRI